MAENADYGKKHIIIEVVLCVLAVVGVIFIVGPFLFLPIAFAYPAIVDKPKLLFIPLGIIGAAFIPLLFIGVIFIIYIIAYAAIMFMFGFGAGVLIHHFRESRGRVKILARIAGIIIMLVPFLFIVDMFTGIVRYPFAFVRIRTYVSRNYRDFDLMVGRLSYDFKSGSFRVEVRNSNNPDIFFNIRLESGQIQDNFTGGSFWARTLEDTLTPILAGRFGGEFYRITSSVRGVQVGQPFDKTADVEKTASITLTTDCATPESLTAHILRYHEFIVQNGFNFTQYTFSFRYANIPPLPQRRRSIDITVPSALINDYLPALIEHARYNRNENGVYSDRAINFRYVSRVGFTPTVE